MSAASIAPPAAPAETTGPPAPAGLTGSTAEAATADPQGAIAEAPATATTTPADPGTGLVRLFEHEHSAEVLPEVQALAGEIRRRHGDGVQGVLFYGSCLRRRTLEGGILDFYVVVDNYRTAYRRTVKGTLLALSNWLMPPNVYYVDMLWRGQRLRMKYNIISQRDFSRACRPASLHAIVWARFCQPAALVWARDAAVRGRLAADAAEAALTLVELMLALTPKITDVEDLWQFAFVQTYATELRPESPETIASVYLSAPQRYREVTELAVAALARRGHLEGRVLRDGLGVDGRLEIRMDPLRQRAVTRRWKWTSALAKAVYLARLLKSAMTFGDWLPYVLWKLDRHTGVYVELTERQRRHPLVWGWPILLRLIRRRTLR